jgi:hypothetical protein
MTPQLTKWVTHSGYDLDIASLSNSRSCSCLDLLVATPHLGNHYFVSLIHY